jgi:hypothetical protein
LREDNKVLGKENRELREQLKSLEDRIERIVADVVERATTPMLERISFLESENERKDNEIKRLKAQIGKDSSNSSKPPGSNGFKKIPNSRELSGKKPGGQPGHKGARLVVPKNLDELVKSGAAEHIVLDHTGGTDKYVSQWTVDMKTVVVYTEYRMTAGSASFISYGNNLKAMSVLLSNEGIIAKKRLSDFFRSVSGGLLSVSVASIEKFDRQAAGKADIDAIKNAVLNAGAAR